MTLTAEQSRALQNGEAVSVTIDGTECVILRKDVYEHTTQVPEYDDSEMSPREVYGLIERVMAEDDANDPALESYQHYERES